MRRILRIRVKLLWRVVEIPAIKRVIERSLRSPHPVATTSLMDGRGTRGRGGHRKRRMVAHPGCSKGRGRSCHQDEQGTAENCAPEECHPLWRRLSRCLLAKRRQ